MLMMGRLEFFDYLLEHMHMYWYQTYYPLGRRDINRQLYIST